VPVSSKDYQQEQARRQDLVLHREIPSEPQGFNYSTERPVVIFPSEYIIDHVKKYTGDRKDR
jgi:hypothetical protein